MEQDYFFDPDGCPVEATWVAERSGTFTPVHENRDARIYSVR